MNHIWLLSKSFRDYALGILVSGKVRPDIREHRRTWVIGVVASVAIVSMAATHTSRWYITAAFTTDLVFWMLLYQQTGSGHIVYRV